jgi:hypothetical protein
MTGKIVVPAAIIPVGTPGGTCQNNQTLYGVSAWLGLGGATAQLQNTGAFKWVNDTNLFQVGVIAQWQCSGNIPAYGAFWQDFATGQSGAVCGANGIACPIQNFPISPGDVIDVSVSAGTDGTMTWSVADESSMASQFGVFTDPGGAYPKWTAEAIVERQIGNAQNLPYSPVPQVSGQQGGDMFTFTDLQYSASIFEPGVGYQNFGPHDFNRNLTVPSKCLHNDKTYGDCAGTWPITSKDTHCDKLVMTQGGTEGETVAYGFNAPPDAGTPPIACTPPLGFDRHSS